MSEPNEAYNSSNYYGLPQKVADEAFSSFTKFDCNRNGSITLDEVKECLQSFFVQFNNNDVEEKFKKYMDVNSDSKVSLDEYMKFMAAVYRHECEGFTLPESHLKNKYNT